jgi:hypothetical protein
MEGTEIFWPPIIFFIILIVACTVAILIRWLMED